MLKPKVSPRRSLLLLPILFLALSGCQVTPTPPLFSLYGHQGIILLPFDNVTQDGALGQAVQDGVTAQLVGLNAAPIYEEGAVSEYLNNLKGDDTDPRSNPAVRQKLAKHFKGDLLLTCNVESYTESVQEQPPQRIMVDYKAQTYKWGFNTVQQVKVTATAKLIDVVNGNISWMKQAYGTGQYQTWTDLEYPGDHPVGPPEGWDNYRNRMKHDRDHGDKDRRDGRYDDRGRNGGNTVVNININNSNGQPQDPAANSAQPTAPVLLYQSDATFANLRQAAIARTVNWLTDDFKGHGGWYPGYTAPPAKQ